MPNSSENEDECEPFEEILPELNSPDSITEDILNPLDTYRSPRRLQTLQSTTDRAKRNPSP